VDRCGAKEEDITTEIAEESRDSGGLGVREKVD
jgi:hypothetical protein